MNNICIVLAPHLPYQVLSTESLPRSMKYSGLAVESTILLAPLYLKT